MELYDMVKTQNDEFLCALEQIEHNWQIISEVVFNHTEEISNIYCSYTFYPENFSADTAARS